MEHVTKPPTRSCLELYDSPIFIDGQNMPHESCPATTAIDWPTLLSSAQLLGWHMWHPLLKTPGESQRWQKTTCTLPRVNPVSSMTKAISKTRP